MHQILKEKSGKKVPIGDNLSSHLNYHVVSMCESNIIKFVASPPNSTHRLQSIDVGYFRSIKAIWRKLSPAGKETVKGLTLRTLPKEWFQIAETADRKARR